MQRMFDYITEQYPKEYANRVSCKHQFDSHSVWKKPAVLITGRDTGENMGCAFCRLHNEQITQNSEKSVDKCIKARYNDNSWNGYFSISIPASLLPNKLTTMSKQ